MTPVPHFNLRRGQWAELDGTMVRFDRRGRDRERRLVFEGTDGVPRDLSDAELLELQYGPERRFKLLTEQEASDRLAGTGRPRTPFPLAATAAGDEARRRLSYVQAWMGAGSPVRTERSIAELVTAHHGQRRADGATPDGAGPPSPRSVLRWIGEWERSGGNIDALVPQTANRGNRTERLNPKAGDLLDRTVEDYYLNDNRPTGVVVMAHVRRAFADYNGALPPADRLAVPGLSSVYRRIGRIDRFTLDCSRHGRRTAEHKWRAVMSGPEATKHNETWEIDHTWVDAVVLDDGTRMPIGRPLVTSAIDRHTRAPTGLHIGFDPPGTYAAMECLRNAILPKGGLLARHPGIAGEWPCMGTPGTLVPDQGREFKSRSFIDACLQLGIAVEYTPVLKAWYKGKIERFFRTLTTSVFQRVPGTTFSSVFERNKEAVPETVAVATLGELREHTLRFLVEVYLPRTHRSLGTSPLQAWSGSVGRHGMDSLPNPDKVEAALSHVVLRVPQRYGFEVEGLTYNSPDVAALRIRPGKPEPIRIAVNPHDLTRISFLDPRTKAHVEVPVATAMRKRVEGVTLEKHRLARALQRANFRTLAGDDGLARSYTILDQSMRELGAARGQDNRRAAARYWEKLNAPRRPEEPSAFDTGASSQNVTDGLFAGGLPPAPSIPPEPPDPPGARPGAGRRQARDAAAVVPGNGALGAPDTDDGDLDALAREMGMGAYRRSPEDRR